MSLFSSLRARLRRVGALISRRRGPFIALSIVIALVTSFYVWRATRPKHERYFELAIPIPAPGADFAFALYQSLGVRALGGHRVELLQNGALFDALIREISAATSSVHVSMYIWEKGKASERVSAALIERARAGVPCRLVLDDWGSPDFMRDVAPALKSAGCEVRMFRPAPAHSIVTRSHRKIVIIDGKQAFTGGFGVRDNWLGDGVSNEAWRDTSVGFSGPAVAEAQLAFAEAWQEAGGALLPPGVFPELERAAPAVTRDGTWAAFVTSTASPELTRSERLTQLMIASAKRRIWIENAYFVPTTAITDLLCQQAKRGVDVRLLVPGKQSDSKTSFGAQHAQFGGLIEHGVRVFEYQPSMLHAKTMVVDGTLSQVGSINLDPLSLSKLEEDALVIQDPALGSALEAAFEADCKHAEEKH